MWNDLQKLNLDETATWSDVQSSCTEQLKRWHPERYKHDQNLQRKCIEKSREINTSFKEIKRKILEIQNKIDFDESKPLLPQFMNSSTQNKANHITQDQYKQEPLLGNKKVTTQTETNNKPKSKYQREEKFSPYLLLALGFLILTLLATLFYIYTTFVKPKPKIVYGPPADLATIYAEKEAEKKLAEEESLIIDPSKDGIVSGQEGSVRILSGISGIGEGSPAAEPKITTAASRCDIVAVKKQLSKGVKINTEDSKGLSALSWASRNGCEDLAKHLLKKGADANHMSINGFTPLAWARWYKNIGVIKVLELRK